MTDFLYQTLAKIGYTHPLHPMLTHLVMGLVIGGFIFSLVAALFRQANLSQTGRHCMGLALIALFPTVLLGYMDWQHRFSGAWLFPIKMKIILVPVLLILLVVAVVLGVRSRTSSIDILFTYLLCLVAVIGIGYFGGELVYGEKAKLAEISEGAVQRGAELFNGRCAGCHFADKTDTNYGPGLLGLFKGQALPASGRPATEDNVRSQLRTPFEKMPAFEDLSEEQIADLIAYMKTL